MAIINNAHDFTGGAVVFNSQPLVNLYGQLLAKKQAKDEALDQYYQNLHKGINPAGMRTIDINSGFSKKLDDWQKYYMDNKEAIKNPRTPEDRAKALQHESMHQDLLMDINKSKEKAAQELTLGKAKMAGNWNPTDQDMEIAHRIGQSIYSPDSYKDPQTQTQPYNLNDVSLNTPQFDPKKQDEFYKAATMGLKPGKTYDETKQRQDKSTGQVYVPYQESYTPDQIKTISDIAGNLFDGSRPAQVHYEHLMHDPNFLIPANAAYQSVYGAKDMVDSPKKAAQAAAIMVAKNPVTTGEELKKDETLAFQRQIYMEGLKQKNRVDLIGEREKAKGAGEAANEVWIDSYINQLTKDAQNSTTHIDYTHDGKTVQERSLDVDPVAIKALTKGKEVPGDITITPDGKYRPIYYQHDANGARILNKDGSGYKVNMELSVPISQQQFKLALGSKAVTPGQRTKEMLHQEVETDVKKLDPSGFKKEGKYWRYKDGRLFDDAGNTIKK